MGTCFRSFLGLSSVDLAEDESEDGLVLGLLCESHLVGCSLRRVVQSGVGRGDGLSELLAQSQLILSGVVLLRSVSSHIPMIGFCVVAIDGGRSLADFPAHVVDGVDKYYFCHSVSNSFDVNK